MILVEVSRGRPRISRTGSHVASRSFRANLIPSLTAGDWQSELTRFDDNFVSFSVSLTLPGALEELK